MRTRLLIGWLVMIPLLAVPTVCPGQETARQFIVAMEAYKNQDYATAARNLEAIADQGVRNGQLYYNIGNAYLKNNDLGHALLWYERALILIPNDPDLRFNCDYARSLTKDIQDENTASLARIFFFWKYRLGAGTIVTLALFFNLSFWIAAGLWRLTRRRGLRNLGLALALPMTVLMLTAVYNYYEAAHHPQAIVLPDKIAVRAGLEPTATELFQLHAGARVKVVRRMSDHLQVHFSDDKIGWVPENAVGRI